MRSRSGGLVGRRALGGASRAPQVGHAKPADAAPASAGVLAHQWSRQGARPGACLVRPESQPG